MFSFGKMSSHHSYGQQRWISQSVESSSYEATRCFFARTPRTRSGCKSSKAHVGNNKFIGERNRQNLESGRLLLSNEFAVKFSNI